MQIETADVNLIGYREENQDRVAIIADERAVLLAVVDGMGGHAEGARAAETALTTLIGAFWLLYLCGYQFSVAVAVGLIALAGIDAETGVVMLIYLDQAYDEHVARGSMNNFNDLVAAVKEGAVQRIRPKMMTMAAILFGLLPIMWSDGSGSEVMKRIAAPMIGGVVTSAILGLLLYPILYVLWRARHLPRQT